MRTKSFRIFSFIVKALLDLFFRVTSSEFPPPPRDFAGKMKLRWYGEDTTLIHERLNPKIDEG